MNEKSPESLKLEVRQSMLPLIEIPKELFDDIGKISGENLGELFFKAVFAILALMMRVDGDVSNEEYSDYVFYCSKAEIQPYSIDTIKRLEEERTVLLFTEAITEINSRFKQYNLDFDAIKLTISNLIKGIAWSDLNIEDTESRLFERIQNILAAI